MVERMVERQKPPQQELEGKARRIGHALDRVRNLIEKPAGDPPWPTRFRIEENITGERFLQQAVEVGQRVSDIKGRLREKTLPILRKKALEIKHLINAAQQPEELVSQIADFVDKGIFPPAVLAKAKEVLAKIKSGPKTDHFPPIEKHEPPIHQKPERKTFKLPDDQVITLTRYLEKRIFQALIDAMNNNQPITRGELRPFVHTGDKNPRSAINTSLLKIRRELKGTGYEIVNLVHKRRSPGEYILKKTKESIDDKALPREEDGLTFLVGGETVTLPDKSRYEKEDVAKATDIDNLAILSNKISLVLDHDPKITKQLLMPGRKMSFKKEDFLQLVNAIRTKKWENHLDPAKNWVKLPDNEVIRIKDALGKNFMLILIAAEAEKEYVLTRELLEILLKGMSEFDAKIRKDTIISNLRKELKLYGWQIDTYLDPHERAKGKLGICWLQKQNAPSLKPLMLKKIRLRKEEVPALPSAPVIPIPTIIFKPETKLPTYPPDSEEEPPLEEPRPLLNTDNVLTKIQIRKQEELEKRRKELREKITLTILSHIRNKILDKLTKKPGELLDDKAHILFQSAAASEEQLEKQLSEFVIGGVAETLEAWWNNTISRTAPEREKESREWLADFRNKKHELKELVQIVCRHFGIETPERYKPVQNPPTSSPGPESPRV